MGNHTHDSWDIVPIKKFADEGGSSIVDLPFFAGEFQIRMKILPYFITIQIFDADTALNQLIFNIRCEGCFTGGRPSYKPKCERH